MICRRCRTQNGKKFSQFSINHTFFSSKILTTVIDDWLGLNHPSSRYSDLPLTRARTMDYLDFVPAGLPYHQIAVTGEYAQAPESLVHRAQIRALDPHGETLLDVAMPVHRLSNREIALVYEPETVDDHEIISAHGGMGNTPGYLVRLRPVLQVDGERTAVGQAGLPTGEALDLEVALISPHGSETIVNSLGTGNLAVLGLAAQDPVAPAPAPDSSKDAARLLHEAAIDYLEQWSRAENELASLLRLALIRPLPSLATLGGAVEVAWLMDAPHGFDWLGVYIIKLRFLQ